MVDNKKRRLRRNEEIRASQVRLVDKDGQQLGIVALHEALDRAEEAHLDLIEMVPDSSPPVCKILDWGKHIREQQEKEREQRKQNRTCEVKELRLRPVTGENDLLTKCRLATQFLKDGHKVRVEVRFRGREITHQDLGKNMLEKFAVIVEADGVVEKQPMMDGRNMFLMLAPRSK